MNGSEGGLPESLAPEALSRGSVEAEEDGSGVQMPRRTKGSSAPRSRGTEDKWRMNQLEAAGVWKAHTVVGSVLAPVASRGPRLECPVWGGQEGDQ